MPTRADVVAGDAALVVFKRFARSTARTGAIWGSVFAIYVVASVEGFISTYPTAASRAQLATSLGSNAGLQALFGMPTRIGTVAGFTAWRTLAVLVIVGAVWGILTSTRLLRGEEDLGRWELLLAGPTTRARATAGALAGMGIGVGVLWAITAASVLAAGRAREAQFGIGASLFFAIALTASAALFMAIGALCSQLAATRRQAAGLAAGVLGAAFLLRMIADSGTTLRWIRWTTPIGWIEALQPLVSTNALPLVPIVATTVGAGWLAVALAAQRDIGGSVLPDRDGAAPRTRLLNGPFGLATRLARGTTIAWTVGVGVSGFVMGLVARAAGEAIAKSNAFAKIQASLGGHAAGAAAYLGIAFVTVSALVGLQAAAQASATREEEAQGHLDNLLVRRVSRLRWLTARLSVAAAALVVVGVVSGFAAWVGAASQNAGVPLGKLVVAGINVVPIGIFVLGLGTLAQSVVPRATTAIVYAVVAWSFLVEIVGGVIGANHWVLDLSLFHHIAPAPAADPRWTADVLLVVIGVALAVCGAARFVRRDIMSA
jgi:ABC-2 type transport system permease protein